MKKRSVLAPVKKIEEPPPEPEEQPPERADLDDKEIFELPKTKVEEPVRQVEEPVRQVEEPPPEKPKSKRQQRDYSYLQEARQKSLETRRRKAEEKKRMEEELTSYKEQLQFERLSNKAGRMEISQRNERQPEQPPPVSRQAPPTSVASTKPEHDISHNIIDYDRLIGGVAERLESQNDYFSQLEHDIRADERKKAEATYQEQLKSWEKQQHRQYQREQAYGAMSNTYKRNHVFDRTTKLRQQYTERYKNGWY